MALYDVDKRFRKGSLDGLRLNPQPNAADKVIQRLAHGTVQIQNKRDDSSGGSIRFEEGRIIVNDGTTDRVLIGYLSGGF